jgi:hypothetical protein
MALTRSGSTCSTFLERLHVLALKVCPIASQMSYLLFAMPFLQRPDQWQPYWNLFRNHPDFPEISSMLQASIVVLKNQLQAQENKPCLTSSDCSPKKRKRTTLEMIQPQKLLTMESTTSASPLRRMLEQLESPPMWSGSAGLRPIPGSARIERKCKNCMTTQFIIEDVQEGHAVCTQCGIIQSSVVMETALTNAQYHPGLSRDVVHRYSRWIYLRSIIQATLGETNVEMTVEQQSILRHHADEHGEYTPNSVRTAIRLHKLPYRLRRHAVTITSQLWPRQQPASPNLMSVGQSELVILCRRFREYEDAWDSARSVAFKGERKFFLNYRVLWRRIVLECDFPHLEKFFEPMKNVKLQKKAEQLVESIATLIQ